MTSGTGSERQKLERCGRGERESMKEFDPKELSQFNGKPGYAVYIAYQGKVFDVSNSKLWKGGSHMRRHYAGEDLTEELEMAPHGAEVFERYPQVGVVRK